MVAEIQKIDSVPYRQWSIEENPFPELFVDLTFRCNMKCPMCYSDSGGAPASLPPDLDLATYTDICKRLPRSTILALVGGEPTLHKDFFEFIATTHQFGHQAFVTTNGIRFAKDPKFVAEFSRLSRTGPTRVHLDVSGGRSPSLCQKIHGQDTSLLKVQALEHLQEFKVGKVLIACVLIRGLNESAIGDVFALADAYKRIVRIVKFRAQGHNGRFIEESAPYRTTEIISLLKPYITEEQFSRAVKLSGHLEGKSYSPDARCLGKSCCFHFQPHTRLEVNP